MRNEYIRLLTLQFAVVLTGAVIVYWQVSSLAAKSYAYGTVVVMVGATILALQHRRSESRIEEVESVLRHAYKTAIQRFVWAIFLLAVGFKFLGLAPLWLLVGFVAGQVTWMFVPIWMRLRTQNDN